MQKFHLIFWCGNFVETHSFVKHCRNRTSPQDFYTVNKTVNKQKIVNKTTCRKSSTTFCLLIGQLSNFYDYFLRPSRFPDLDCLKYFWSTLNSLNLSFQRFFSVSKLNKIISDQKSIMQNFYMDSIKLDFKMNRIWILKVFSFPAKIKLLII